MMTAITLIERAGPQRTVAVPSAARADIALRPAELKQGAAALFFCAVIPHKLYQAIAFLELDLVFHDAALAHPVTSSIGAESWLSFVGNQKDIQTNCPMKKRE